MPLTICIHFKEIHVTCFQIRLMCEWLFRKNLRLISRGPYLLKNKPTYFAETEPWSAQAKVDPVMAVDVRAEDISVICLVVSFKAFAYPVAREQVVTPCTAVVTEI